MRVTMNIKDFVLRFIFGVIALCTLSFFFGCKTEKLSAPENLTENDLVLSWNAVENANGYSLLIDGEEFLTEENFFDFKTITTKTEYSVKIKALSNEKAEDSDYVDYLLKVISPVSLGYDENGYRFTLTKDGDGYEISKGKADFTDIMFLPSTFCGLPVIGIEDYGFDGSNGSDKADILSEKFCNLQTNDFILPSFLQYIGKYAFSYNIRIEKIEMTDTVTEVKEGAFYGCKRLKDIKFSENLKQIQDKAFACCALKSLELPNGLEVIGNSAFDALIDETTRVPNFTEQYLMTIRIPNSVKTIGNCAFRGACELFFNNLRMSGGIEYLGADIFCYSYMGFVLPNCTRNVMHTVILNKKSYFYSFYFGSSFAENTEPLNPAEESYNFDLSIYNYLTVFGSYSFARLNEVKTITLGPDCRLAGSFIFAYCPALETVNLDFGFETLPESIFEGCVSLNSIIIEEGTVNIAKNAFKNCSSLKYAVIPKTLSSLDTSAFEGCTALDTLFFNGNADEYQAVKEVVSSSKELNFATVYFYSEDEPTTQGNFWHYQDDKPVIW